MGGLSKLSGLQCEDPAHCGRLHSLGRNHELSTRKQSEHECMHFSLLWTTGVMCLHASHSCCLNFPTVMSCNLKLCTKIKPFFPCVDFCWGYFLTASGIGVGQKPPLLYCLLTRHILELCSINFMVNDSGYCLLFVSLQSLSSYKLGLFRGRWEDRLAEEIH